MSGRLGDASGTSIRRRPTAGLSPNPPRSPYSLSPYLTHDEDSDLAASGTCGIDSPKSPHPFHDSAKPSASGGFPTLVEDRNGLYKAKESVSHPSTASHSRSHKVEASSSPFHAVPLTPEMESRSCSVQGHTAKSRSPTASIPPRLPTPDFSLLREPLRQALVLPLNFFRSRSARQSQQSTNSQQTSSTSRVHHSPSLSSHRTPKPREESRQSEKPTFKLQEASSLPSFPVFWSPTAGTTYGKPPGLGSSLTISESGKEINMTFISNSWKWERGVLFLSVFVVSGPTEKCNIGGLTNTQVFSIGFGGLLYSILLWFRAIRISGIVVITQYDLSLCERPFTGSYANAKYQLANRYYSRLKCASCDLCSGIYGGLHALSNNRRMLHGPPIAKRGCPPLDWMRSVSKT